MKLVGEVNINRTFKCVKCGSSLWGDNGWLQDDNAMCVREDRCSRKVASNKLAADAAQGIKPRWR